MPSLVANPYRGYGPVSGGGGTAPNTPTLSQPVDNGDGTGATASITGSSAGSTNQVYTAPWAAAGNNLTWTLAATRTGDGAVALALADGYYVAKCESVLSSLPAMVSNEPTFQVTGGATFTSVSAALAASLVSKLQGMVGTQIIGIATSSIRRRKTAYIKDFSGVSPPPPEKQYSLPALVVCYFDQFDVPPEEGPQDRDAIYVPITFVFEQQTQSYATPSEALDDQFLAWQEAVLSTMQHLRGFTGGHLSVTAGGKTYTFHNAIYRGGKTFSPSPERELQNTDVGWMKFGFLLWRQAYGT